MHFCMDELRIIALALGVGGVTLAYILLCLRNFWHRIWHRGSPKDDGCCTKHDHD